MKRLIHSVARISLAGSVLAAAGKPTSTLNVVQETGSVCGPEACSTIASVHVPAAALTPDAAIKDTLSSPSRNGTRQSQNISLLRQCDRMKRACTEKGKPPKWIRGRVASIFTSIDRDLAHYLEERDTDVLIVALLTLAEASEYLQSRRIARYRDRSVFLEGDTESDWEGTSPYCSSEMSDWLSACLRQVMQQPLSTAERMALLSSAVQLEIGDTSTLKSACRWLTSVQCCRDASGEELAEILHIVSLCVKRSKIPKPGLDHVLCKLSVSQPSQRGALRVLCALVRLHDEHAAEVVQNISRRAVRDVEFYSVQDTVFALEAIALLNNCNEVFSGSVLDRCGELSASFRPQDLGSACKYVALLSPTRTTNQVAATNAKELRRLLPALLARAEALHGQFSLRDARCILRCMAQHKVRHSVVLSQLTLLVAEG